MDTNIHSNTNLRFKTTKVGEESVTFHDQPSSVGVNIDFSCNTTLRSINYEESSTQRVMTELQLPRISNSISIKPEQFLSFCKTREVILPVVRFWPLFNSQREDLIRKVIFRAWEFAKSMSRNHNLLILYVDAYVVRYHVNSNDVSDRIPESLEGSNGNSMVPAIDSSIKSLERKIIEDDYDDLGSCTVCLDKFSKGSEAVTMPCSHMFHSNCIEQWLRTSHYCPVCRFEMPTS